MYRIIYNHPFLEPDPAVYILSSYFITIAREKGSMSRVEGWTMTLLGSLEEDHLLHGVQRPHGEGAIQTTAGKMAASHTEGHAGHLQRFRQERYTHYFQE